MGRNRVLSFMSQFSTGSRSPTTPASSPPSASPDLKPKSHPNDPFPNHSITPQRTPTPPKQSDYGNAIENNQYSPQPSPTTRKRSSSRPLSISQGHIPPLMDVSAEDVVPELLPVFTLLNSHSNKLYQEGYFLKLDDQNTQGRPNGDRTWTECFAQLVGTVLSLWDAAELDAAGEDGEVLPKFINLTDASIKMIESLPTRSKEEQPLQNILSISTAGKNRYLLHFNSHQSLVQWTAGIRLAMFEHSTLQEAYTGALIAGKGKTLNNINVIMERSRLKTEEWVRVRFGAGVPWRRCWCVITPPDEKEYAKQMKEIKKKSAYDKTVPTVKGDIKFYDTKIEGKKQKKAQPIASITDAYAAYAIYPQARALVDASTLLKIEGNIAIHTDPPSSSEGFVFIMPETRPMVSGFEMLLRFLFPTWDTFGLYGRPGKLVASSLDQRSLMFAMPRHKRYGYLEILDVTGLINDGLSPTWNEKEWRRKLKEATGIRMNGIEDGTIKAHSRGNSRNSNRLSFGGNKGKVGFADDGARSNSMNNSAPPPAGAPGQWQQSPNMPGAHPPRGSSSPGLGPGQPPSRGPSPGMPPQTGPPPMRSMNTPEPVSQPPAFNNHGPQDRAVQKAYHSPELRRANSRLSNSTLAQMATANGLNFSKDNDPNAPQGRGHPMPVGPDSSVQHQPAASAGTYANGGGPREALGPNQGRIPGNPPPPFNDNARSRSPMPNGPGPKGPAPYGGPNSRPPNGPPNGPPPGNMRPGPGGPGGGRGRPPPGQGGPPPPPHGDYRQRPGPGGPGGPGGPPGRPGPDGRKPLPMRGPPPPNMTDTDDIIDAYSDPAPGPRPPPHGGGRGGMDDRPRAGVMKTVAGGEPPLQPRSQFDIPDVNFGPTVNYGAGNGLPPRKHIPGPGEGGPRGPGGPMQQRPYTPNGNPNGRNSPMPYAGEEGQRKPMAWQPGGSSAGSGGAGLSPEQFVQQRAGNYGPGRTPSPYDNRGPSPQPAYPRGAPPPGPGQRQPQGQYQSHGSAF